MDSINKNKHLAAAIVLLFVLLGINLIVFSNKRAQDDYYKNEFRKNYKVYSLNLPSKLDFAGEAVPLNQFDVRESLDRELLLNTYWQSQSILLHKRAYRWFQKISPILKKNGIPDDFKYVALIESGFTNAVSPSGASGFWQFLDKTANNYGLTVNENIDERYHIQKATEAACKYFKEAYAKFGNWTLVAASYNMGINGIAKQMESQKVSNYYDLLLNQETARYIFRILALKEIMQSPQKYGFILRKSDLYPQIPIQQLAVDSSISNIADFSQKIGYNYKLIKLLNPWLRQNFLENKNKNTFVIDIPTKNFDEMMLNEIYLGNPKYNLKNDSLGFIPSTHNDSSHFQNKK
ncbi:MAG TPA: lytic transglycosylase domain-containing protein [Bacteroidia bacterium]|nr:lytic transglycosylase domain-containing protein [Bacteroidia bacterium]